MAPSLQVPHEFFLSQRGKRVLGEELAGLIGRSLNCLNEQGYLQKEFSHHFLKGLMSDSFTFRLVAASF